MSREEEGQKEGLSGAMKIFEALSSVDEELLTRSEDHKGYAGHKRVIPFGRFAKVMAACICFVVLGVAAYTGVQLHTAKENMSADCASSADVKEATEGAARESALDEPVEAVEGAVAETVEGVVAEDTPEKETDAGADITMSKDTLDEEALRATEILGAYLPTKLPAGYVYESGCGIDENHPEQGISLQWTDGVDTLRISVREYMPEQSLNFQYPIFAENEFTLEAVEEHIKQLSGEMVSSQTHVIHFAVLYDSGILVECYGGATAEDIWEMFASIGLEE